MSSPGDAELARVEAELATRWPESRLDPTIARIAALVDLLGSPQRTYPVVHVAGTNGKTSTCRMISSLLTAFGLRIGRITSPHLESVTERIVLDSAPISGERFAAVYDDIAPYVAMVDAQQPVPMSYFEVLTAMGFVAFADTPVDVAVVEVGMGGRWDSTNVADGQVAVITPIALDHTRYLGNTVAAIAGEKAGIIKAGATAILAAQDPAAGQVLERAAVDAGASVAREGADFGVADRRPGVDGQLLTLQGLSGRYDDVFLPLYGGYQAQNAACSLAAVETFLGAGPERALAADLVREGFAAARSPGRLEIVRSSPTVLVDASHNPAGMAATVAAVRESFAFRRLIGVVAIVADKDAHGILDQLEPLLDHVVVTESSSHRRMPAGELGELASVAFGSARVSVIDSLADAIDEAIGRAGSDDLAGAGVLVTGSVITAGDARAMLGADHAR